MPKQPMMLRVIDMGGSGVRRADIDTETMKPKHFVKTPGAVASLEELIAFVGEDLDSETSGIAFAVAGIIEHNSLIVKSPNIPFLDNVDLAGEIQSAYNIKTAIFNDMESAVAGMAYLLPNESYFMGITWSSGIGTRIAYHGNLLSNSEGGHMKLRYDENAPLCGCMGRGCAEAIIGGLAIGRRIEEKVKELGIVIVDSPYVLLNEAFEKNEPWAKQFYGDVAKDMGKFLANIQNLLCLPLLVWRGTFAVHALPHIETTIREAMSQYVINPAWAQKEYVQFQMSPDATFDAMIGAAVCFQKLQQ